MIIITTTIDHGMNDEEEEEGGGVNITLTVEMHPEDLLLHLVSPI